MAHVDEFIEDHTSDRYASFVLMLMRLPAIYQNKWRDQILANPLFCTYKGDRYRITGASRFGDVWLATNPKRTTGYDHRVDLADCSEFSNEFKFPNN